MMSSRALKTMRSLGLEEFHILQFKFNNGCYCLIQPSKHLFQEEGTGDEEEDDDEDDEDEQDED